LSEGERIGGGSVENEINVTIRFEKIPNQFPDTTCLFIIAVGNGCVVISLFQCR
jgi:hypothetical protein